jgi:glycosyltransferase involved in cell wall biosynthesis
LTTVVSVTPVAVQRDSRTYKIAASLARAGYRSIVVEAEASTLRAAPFELRSVGARPNGLPPEGVRAWAKRVPWGYDAARAVRHLTRSNLPLLPRLPPADLYYLHAPYQWPAVRWAAARHGAPIVYDAHDFYTVLYDPPSPVVRWVEGRCIRDAAAVVTVSEGIGGLIEAEFGRRPAVLMNSHDPRLEQAPARGIREELGLPADAFCLVSSGGNPAATWTFTPLLEALAALPPHVHLLLLGGRGRGFLPEVARAGLTGRVHVADAVAPAEVVPFLRSADAFIVAYGAPSPNYVHSLPNRFFQAIAAGLPVLYPPLPEMARLAEQHGLGLAVDPSSPASIRAAVETLLGERAAFAARLEAAGRALSWQTEEPALFGLIEAALAQGGSSRSTRRWSSR